MIGIVRLPPQYKTRSPCAHGTRLTELPTHGTSIVSVLTSRSPVIYQPYSVWRLRILLIGAKSLLRGLLLIELFTKSFRVSLSFVIPTHYLGFVLTADSIGGVASVLKTTVSLSPVICNPFGVSR